MQAERLEPGAAPTTTASALAREVKLMAKWLGLARVEVAPRGDLAGWLAELLEG